MQYRREVDGLRALAVLPVILFHAGFDTFSGGFIGVDVFFVISGYLITNIILEELDKEQFSIIDFYERRARRILPALFLVILVCIPLAWIWLLPSYMKEFSQSLIAVSIFASNILFWHESGYFETVAELKPLLHTWSLAVEEQFYILFPLFLMLFWKLGKHLILFTLGLVFLLSILLAQLWVYTKPSAAFYLLPTRGWELLIGVFIAFYLSQPNRKGFGKGLSEFGGWLGVALILFAVFVFSKATPFPGIYALVPTLGATLIILFATQQTTVGKFIGNKVFVGIGLISYSAYLWHQPLFAFAKHNGYSNSNTLVFFLLAVFSIFLAYLSWKYVEAPFRRKSFVSRQLIFLFAILGSLLFILLGWYGYKENGDIRKLSNEQKLFLSYFNNELPAWNYFVKAELSEKYRDDCNFFDIQKYRTGKSTRVPLESIAKSCYTKNLEDSKVVFIWGDSHAQQLYYGLSKVLPKDYEVLQVASSGCLANTEAKQSRDDYCEQSNWFAYNVIKIIKPNTVIIGQNIGHNFATMERLSADLRSIGVQRIIFTGPTPHWVPSLPAVIARMVPNVPERTFLGLDTGVMDLDLKLKKNANKTNLVEYLSLIDYFCDKYGCLTHYSKDVAESVTSWDYGHLTPIASQQLAKDILVPIITKTSNSN